MARILIGTRDFCATYADVAKLDGGNYQMIADRLNEKYGTTHDDKWVSNKISQLKSQMKELKFPELKGQVRGKRSRYDVEMLNALFAEPVVAVEEAA